MEMRWRRQMLPSVCCLCHNARFVCNIPGRKKKMRRKIRWRDYTQENVGRSEMPFHRNVSVNFVFFSFLILLHAHAMHEEIFSIYLWKYPIISVARFEVHCSEWIGNNYMRAKYPCFSDQTVNRALCKQPYSPLSSCSGASQRRACHSRSLLGMRKTFRYVSLDITSLQECFHAEAEPIYDYSIRSMRMEEHEKNRRIEWMRREKKKPRSNIAVGNFFFFLPLVWWRVLHIKNLASHRGLGGWRLVACNAMSSLLGSPIHIYICMLFCSVEYQSNVLVMSAFVFFQHCSLSSRLLFFFFLFYYYFIYITFIHWWWQWILRARKCAWERYETEI